MVGKTFWKACFRAVRSSLSRFLAIFAIVALGTGFLAGLMATTPDMRHTVSDLYQRTHLYDLRVMGTLGLEEGDAQALAQVEGVAGVMPAKSLDREVLLPSGDGLTARFHGVTAWEGEDPARLNRLELVEGRWPQTDNECVVLLENNLRKDLLRVGETLTLAPQEPEEDGEVPEEHFTQSVFTITGVVTSGYYVSTVQRGSTTVGNGSLGCIAFVKQSVIDLDYYTDLFVAVEGSQRAESFTEGYDRLVDPVKERVEQLAESQRHVRADRLRQDAQKEVDEAQAELNDKEAEGRQELADALAELTQGEEDYAQGLADYQDGFKQLADGRAELADAEAKLPEALQKLEDGEAEYDQGLADYQQGWEDYQEGIRQADQAQEELADAYRQIQEGKAELNKALAQLESGEAEMNAGEAQLDRAEAQLKDAQDQLDAAQAQIDQRQAQIDQGMDQLENQQSQLEQSMAQLDQALSAGLISPEAYDEQMAQLDQAQSQLEDARRQLEEGQEQLSQAKAQLEQQQAQIDQGMAQVSQGRQELSQGSSALTEGWEAYNAARKEMDEAELQYRLGEYQLTESRAQLEQARMELEDAQVQLEDARKELDDGWAEYEQGQRDIAGGWVELQENESKLTDAQAELEDARKELDDGWAEYADGEKELEDQVADARLKLRDAQEQIDEIEDPTWYVLSRSESNEGYIFYESDTEKVAAIARVFPMFFFLVAALVASTTMTRMIDEDRGTLGTLKALGYSNAAIAGKYLAYAALACLLGAAAGLALGLPLFPRVISNAYSMMYQLPAVKASGHLGFILLSTAVILAAVLAATLGALRGSLRDNAAALMRPKAPPAGKRILLERVKPVWRQLTFTQKITARNLFRYKKRFFMTIVGITGCTALLLTGFGLRDSIRDIVNVQFTQLETYNLTLNLKHGGDETADRRMAAILQDPEQVTDYLPVHRESGVLRVGDRETDVFLVVPSQPERFGEFHVFRDRVTQEPVAFPAQGAILTEKAAKVLGLDVGDSVLVRNQDDLEARIPIAGICENYVQSYLFFSQEVYEAAFGESCEFSTILAKANASDQQSRDDMSAALLQSSNATGVSFSTTTIETFADMLSSVDYIVVVLILSAAALAFVVLYNLTNINICERQKEIATLKVLGFRRGEVSGYIFRETALLSVFGAAAGLFFGVFLHQFVVQTAEVDAVMFGRMISPASYFYAAGLTGLFTFLVSIAMAYKLRKIDMVESLKAPE